MATQKTGKITKPTSGTQFCFDEVIQFQATAQKVDAQGVTTDISDQIQWRKPAKATGPKYQLSFQDRKNAIVAIYLSGKRAASVKLKIVCCPYEPGVTYTSEIKALARIMMAEGDKCVPDERRALGYAVVNRLRFYPNIFGSTLDTVINQPGQFGGIQTDLYELLGSETSIADELVYQTCGIYKETLKLAREVLADGNSQGELLFKQTGQHAFYFNQAADSPPNGKITPLIKSKNDTGWRHSFYGRTG